MERDGQPGHGGGYLRHVRERAGMTLPEVAARAGVDPAWLADVEQNGTEPLSYSEIAKLVRATQPPRPDWWDDGHEHDLLVGPHGYTTPATESVRRYWERIEAVRAGIQ